MLPRPLSSTRPYTLFPDTTLFRSLVLEYAVAAGAVSVGWSGYFVGLLREYLGIQLPAALVNADALIAHVKLIFGAAPSEAIDTAIAVGGRSEEHTSELQSLMSISYAVFCLKKKTRKDTRQRW